MLQRSAGDAAQTAPPPLPLIATSATAVALCSGANESAPANTNAPMTGVTGTGTTSNTNHRIRLVPHLDTQRSLRFDPIVRDLKEGDPALRICRITDWSELGLAAANAQGSNKLVFGSKVLSRTHAEIWVENGGRFFVKDKKSTSGTFLNHVRLSPANTESTPYEIKDGDILQLGINFQGGTKDIYMCVKMKIEIGPEWQASRL